MPDTQPDKPPEKQTVGIGPIKVESTKDSHVHKITIANAEGKTVDVEPGSKLHEVLVHDTDTSDNRSERRKPQPTAQINVQPSAGGMTGWPATIANMSATGFVLVLCFLMYQDFRSTVKERDNLMREEMRGLRDEMRNESRLSRESNDKTVVNLTTALSTLSTKIDAMAISNAAVASELRTSRLAFDSKLEKIIGKMNNEDR